MVRWDRLWVNGIDVKVRNLASSIDVKVRKLPSSINFPRKSSVVMVPTISMMMMCGGGDGLLISASILAKTFAQPKMICLQAQMGNWTKIASIKPGGKTSLSSSTSCVEAVSLSVLDGLVVIVSGDGDDGGGR